MVVGVVTTGFPVVFVVDAVHLLPSLVYPVAHFHLHDAVEVVSYVQVSIPTIPTVPGGISLFVLMTPAHVGKLPVQGVD